MTSTEQPRSTSNGHPFLILLHAKVFPFQPRLVVLGQQGADQTQGRFVVREDANGPLAPAGTGIMIHLRRVANEWLPLLLSLLISTAATLAVAALVMKLCMRGQTAPGKAP
jgi:hypothetical protein